MSALQQLPDGSWILAAVGVANFLAVLAVLRALAPSDPMAARVRAHGQRRAELRAALLKPRSTVRHQPISLARRMLERLKLHRGEDARTAAGLLAQAGWRSADATTVFLAVRVAGPLLLALIAYAAAPLLRPDAGNFARLTIAGLGAVAGVYLPMILLKNAIKRRQIKLLKGLPDVLDLFVICAEAGLSLDAAVSRVGREIGASAPDLADELGLTAVELGFLPDRREALTNLARRTGMPQVRGLVNTLVQTEKYGTPLAQSLRVLAAEFRDTRMMKAEEKAARLPATLTVPMILFVLPPLFIILIGPAIIQVLATSFS
jgi:tight adherence protein C